MVVYDEARVEALADAGELDGDEPWEGNLPEPARLPDEQVGRGGLSLHEGK